MGHSDRVSSLFFLCFGLFVLFYTLTTLPIGTLHDPQAGFFPLLVGFVLTVVSAVMVFRAFREKRIKPLQFGNLWKKVLLSAIGIILYVFFLEEGGFLLCTFLFVFFYLKGIERVGWVPSLVFTISTVFFTYFSFSYLLGIPLPQGIIPL